MKNKKNLLKLIPLFTILILLSACLGIDDEQLIVDRITNLEKSINEKDYLNFLNNFHPDANKHGNYTKEEFEELNVCNYYFKNKEVKITEKEAIVKCSAYKKDELGETEELTVFSLKEIDNNWLILRWEEEGTPLYYKIGNE